MASGLARERWSDLFSTAYHWIILTLLFLWRMLAKTSHVLWKAATDAVAEYPKTAFVILFILCVLFVAKIENHKSLLVLRVRLAAEGYAKYWQAPIASSSASDLEVAVRRIVLLMTSDKYPEMLGRMYLAQNKFCDALAVFEQWELHSPGQPDPLFYVGYTLARMGEYELAEFMLHDVLDIAPQHYLSLGTLGFALLQEHRYQESLAYSEKAHKLKPNAPNYVYNVAMAYARLGDVQNAISHYKEALSLDHKYVAAEYNWGQVLEQEHATDHTNAQSNLEEAIQHYHSALRIEPTFVLALDALQKTLTSEKRYDEADNSCKESALLNPGSPAPLMCLGNVAYAKGQMDVALAKYIQASQYDYANAYLQYKIGDIEERMNAYDKALEYYQSAARLQPKERAYAISAGNTEFKLGDEQLKHHRRKQAVEHFNQAMAFYCRALEIDPHSEAGQSNLSLASHKLNSLGNRPNQKGDCLKILAAPKTITSSPLLSASASK